MSFAEMGNVVALARLLQQGEVRHAAAAEQYLRLERDAESGILLEADDASGVAPELREAADILQRTANRLVSRQTQGIANMHMRMNDGHSYPVSAIHPLYSSARCYTYIPRGRTMFIGS